MDWFDRWDQTVAVGIKSAVRTFLCGSSIMVWKMAGPPALCFPCFPSVWHTDLPLTRSTGNVCCLYVSTWLYGKWMLTLTLWVQRLQTVLYAVTLPLSGIISLSPSLMIFRSLLSSSDLAVILGSAQTPIILYGVRVSFYPGFKMPSSNTHIQVIVKKTVFSADKWDGPVTGLLG